MITNHRSCRILFGPPGTGKTTALLHHIEQLLADKAPASSMAFLAFTKKASQEAKDRARDKFSLPEREFQWFRTIHSFAFQRLGLRRTDVLGRRDLDQLAFYAGVEIQGAVWTEDGVMAGGSEGDKLLFLDNLARMRRVPLKQVWEEDDHQIEWGALEQFSRVYKRFRQERGLFDYTDMLESFIKGVPVPEFHTLIVDESQDLSALQWLAIQQIAKYATNVIIAGDPDQAIFRWSGAEATGMMRAEGERVALEQSHRIPASVHSLAMEIRSRIPGGTTNVFNPRPEPGKVEYIGEPEMVDLGTGSWLLLARHVHMLRRLERLCEQQGVAYESRGKRLVDSPSLRAVVTWEALRKGEAVDRQAAVEMASFLPSSSSECKVLRGLKSVSVTLKNLNNGTALPVWHEALTRMPDSDRAFYLSARRRGEKLLAKPRVTIGTIHSAKGGEADNVLLMTDISKSSFENMQRHPEDEARTFYVGATRARHSLFVIRPQTELSYEM